MKKVVTITSASRSGSFYLAGHIKDVQGSETKDQLLLSYRSSF